MPNVGDTAVDFHKVTVTNICSSTIASETTVNTMLMFVLKLVGLVPWHLLVLVTTVSVVAVENMLVTKGSYVVYLCMSSTGVKMHWRTGLLKIGPDGGFMLTISNLTCACKRYYIMLYCTLYSLCTCALVLDMNIFL